MTRDAPTVAPVWRNSRRAWVARVMLHLPGRAVDRAAHALVGTTAADVGHRLVDLGVGGARLLGEQRRRGQHLSRLAEPALRHVLRDPGSLHRMAPVAREPFDRRD